MTTQTAGTSVHLSVLVDAPIAHAFKVFTEEMGTWWPPGHHLLASELRSMVFEPRPGGHIYDIGVDGEESHWSRVLAYDPPNRVVFTWDISARWEIETNPAKASEIEITFVAESPTRTRVELEHRNLDRHGDGWESMREAVGSSDGWRKGLDAFAKAAA